MNFSNDTASQKGPFLMPSRRTIIRSIVAAALLSLAVFFDKTRLIDNVVLEKAKTHDAAGAGG
jgi:hypothetical protein